MRDQFWMSVAVEAALDVVDLADRQTPRAGTVMPAQTEAVDFFAFDNSYARLPDRFFARLRPAPVAAPRLVSDEH